jgi:hypothetical protein
MADRKETPDPAMGPALFAPILLPPLYLWTEKRRKPQKPREVLELE